MTNKDLALTQNGLPPPDVFMSPTYRYGRSLDVRENNTWEITMHKIGRVALPVLSGVGSAFLAEKAILLLWPAITFSWAVLLVGSVFIINVLVCECMRNIGHKQGELYAVSQLKDGMQKKFRNGVFV